MERFVLGELSVVAQSGHDVAEPVERAVQVVHPSALASVGGQSAFLHHLRSHFLERPFLSVGCAAGAARKRQLGIGAAVAARLVLMFGHQRMNGRRSRADWGVDRRVVVVAVERRAGRTGSRQTGGDVTAFGIVFDADPQVVVVAGRAVARRLGKVLQPLADLLIGGSDR